MEMMEYLGCYDVKMESVDIKFGFVFVVDVESEIFVGENVEVVN